MFATIAASAPVSAIAPSIRDDDDGCGRKGWKETDTNMKEIEACSALPALSGSQDEKESLRQKICSLRCK